MFQGVFKSSFRGVSGGLLQEESDHVIPVQKRALFARMWYGEHSKLPPRHVGESGAGDRGVMVATWLTSWNQGVVSLVTDVHRKKEE